VLFLRKVSGLSRAVGQNTMERTGENEKATSLLVES